jgi:ankyrin repeat protein
MSKSERPSAPSPRGDADAAAPRRLPERPNLEHLRNEAKQRLQVMRRTDPAAKLTAAQFAVARSYGHQSWRAMREAVLSINATQIGDAEAQAVHACRTGDASLLALVLDAHPEAIDARGGPWNKPLLHVAAWEGHPAVVRELISRGVDVNARCETDHACAMHFAAEEGYLGIVRMLAEAGGDVVGQGDDHEMGVLGWATCLSGLHEDVAAYLMSRGAKLHIFSAVALNRGDAVRSMVAGDRSLLDARMSRHEHHRRPLHLAVMKNRPAVVRLLLDLGADATAADDAGTTPMQCLGRVGVDRPIDPSIPAMLAEAGGSLDLPSLLRLGRFDDAEAMLAADPDRLDAGGEDAMALHLAVAGADGPAARWLIDHGADPNAKRVLWDCNQAPLHTCGLRGRVEIAAMLLDAGADAAVRDDTHDATPLAWADYCGQPAVAELLRSRGVEV